MKTWVIICSISIFNLACGQQRKQQRVNIQSNIEKERLSLKNAAFCGCLDKSFPQKDSIFVNEGSAAGYLELGSYSIEAYNKVMEAGANHAKIKYSSKYNRDLSIMKCLDFYNSKELDDLVKSLDSELSLDDLKK